MGNEKNKNERWRRRRAPRKKKNEKQKHSKYHNLHKKIDCLHRRHFHNQQVLLLAEQLRMILKYESSHTEEDRDKGLQD